MAAISQSNKKIVTKPVPDESRNASALIKIPADQAMIQPLIEISANALRRFALSVWCVIGSARAVALICACVALATFQF